MKGLAMDARFLRDEAARFRGMADNTDREATKARLLAMAADYQARVGLANELAEPNLVAPNSEVATPNLDEVISETEPNLGEAIQVKPGRKIATGVKGTILVERRPVGRRV